MNKSSQLNNYFLTALILILLLCFKVSSASELTWDGGATDNWSTQANWVENTSPTSSDHPYFTANASPGTSKLDGAVDWAVSGIYIGNSTTDTTSNISHTLDLNNRRLIVNGDVDIANHEQDPTANSTTTWIINNGTLQVGTANVPQNLTLGKSWRSSTGIWVVENGAILDGHFGTVDIGNGYGNRGVLDLRNATALTRGTETGVFRAEALILGSGGNGGRPRYDNEILFGSSLTSLEITTLLSIGDGQMTSAWLGKNGLNGTATMPNNVDIKIGIDATNRAEVKISTASWWGVSAHLVSGTGGDFTGYLSNLTVGKKGAGGADTSTGLLDIQHMDSVDLNVSGSTIIGSSESETMMGNGRVSLPEGTAVFTDLIIGSEHGSGILDLYGTETTINNALVVNESGSFNLRIDDAQDALIIGPNATINLKGNINLTFTSEPPSGGMLYGLQVPGDQRSKLSVLHRTGKLTWDTSGLTATAGIYYDAGNTYIALQETWPLSVIPQDVSKGILPDVPTTLTFSIEDLDATLDTQGITSRVISYVDDLTPGDPHLVTLPAMTLSAGAASFTIPITLTLTRNAEQVSDVAVVTVTPIATKTWDGNSGNDNWRTDANWVEGTAPTSTVHNAPLFTHLDSPGLSVLNGSEELSVNGLTVRNPEGGSTVTDISHSLDLNGNLLIVDGDLAVAQYHSAQASRGHSTWQVENGTLQIGTANAVKNLTVGDSSNNHLSTGELIMNTGSVLDGHLGVVTLGADAGGKGILDLRNASTLRCGTALGLFRTESLLMGINGAGQMPRYHSEIRFGTSLTALEIIRSLRIADGQETSAWIGQYGANGTTALPDNVDITLGVDEENRADVVIGNGSYWGVDGHLVSGSGGNFTGYLNSLLIGKKGAGGSDTTTGRLDLQQMSNVYLDVSGESIIGSSTDADKIGIGTLTLPEGTAEFTDLTIGSSYGSGQLDLYGTDVRVTHRLTLNETGVIDLRVNSSNDALTIASTATFTINGIINIRFEAEPPTNGMLYGLQMSGDRRNTLQTLYNAGLLTWDTTGLNAVANIYYDGTHTYVALRESFPLVVSAKDITLGVKPDIPTTFTFHIDEIDTSPSDASITSRSITHANDLTPGDPHLVTLPAITMNYDAPSMDIRITLTLSRNSEQVSAESVVTILPVPVGIPVSYQLPTDGELPQTYLVTLAITDLDNPDWIISTFVAGQPRQVTQENGGRFIDIWDGLDENFMPVIPDGYGVKGIYSPAEQWEVDGEFHTITPRWAGGVSDWFPSPETPEHWEVPIPFQGDPTNHPLTDVDVAENGVAVFYYEYLENGQNLPMFDLNDPLNHQQFIRSFNSGGAAGGPCAVTDGETVWAYCAEAGPRFIYRADGQPFGTDAGATRTDTYLPDGWVTSMALFTDPVTDLNYIYAAQGGEIVAVPPTANYPYTKYVTSETNFINKVTVLAGADGQELGEISLTNPIGLVVRNSTLYALSGTGTSTMVSSVPLVNGLPNGAWTKLYDVPYTIIPTDFEVDNSGRFYLSDAGANKVFQLNSSGSVIRTFGNLDAQLPGSYDPETLMHPGSLATWTDLSGDDRLIIVEHAGPNRVSEWNAENGQFLQDYPTYQTKANHGYVVDPDDPTMIYIPTHKEWITRFKVDYQTHEWTIDAVWPGFDTESIDGLTKPWPIRANGNLYLASGKNLSVFRLDEQANQWFRSAGLINQNGNYSFWNDTNGNGEVDDPLRPTTLPGSVITYHGQRFTSDFSYMGMAMNGRDVWRLSPSGYDSYGNPIFNNWQYLLTDTVFEGRANGTVDAIHGGNELDDTYSSDWMMADGSMSEGFYIQARGGQRFSANFGSQHKISRYVPDGMGGYEMKWRVGRSKLGNDVVRGELTGGMRIFKPINGLLTVIDQSSSGLLLYTDEGLFVDTLFPASDFRDEVGIYDQPGEFFAGNIYANDDNGKIYYAAGKFTPLLYEMENWSLTENNIEDLLSLPTEISISSAQIADPPELALVLRGQSGELNFASNQPVLDSVSLDGSLTGWETADPLSYGTGNQHVEVLLMYDPDHLYIRWHVQLSDTFNILALPPIERIFTHDQGSDTVSFYIQGDPNASPPTSIEGRPGDVRMVFGIFNDAGTVKPVALGMYPDWAGANARPQTYETPVGSTSYAHVDAVEGTTLSHVIDPDEKGFVLVAAIPRSAIPAMVQPFSGDTRTMVNFSANLGGHSKFWWANSDGSANTETYDETSEARFYPGSWAPIRFNEKEGEIRTWDGDAGNDNWRTDANWLEGTSPLSVDTLLFTNIDSLGTSRLDGVENRTIRGLQVRNPDDDNVSVSDITHTLDLNGNRLFVDGQVDIANYDSAHTDRGITTWHVNNGTLQIGSAAAVKDLTIGNSWITSLGTNTGKLIFDSGSVLDGYFGTVDIGNFGANKGVLDLRNATTLKRGTEIGVFRTHSLLLGTGGNGGGPRYDNEILFGTSLTSLEVTGLLRIADGEKTSAWIGKKGGDGTAVLPDNVDITLGVDQYDRADVIIGNGNYWGVDGHLVSGSGGDFIGYLSSLTVGQKGSGGADTTTGLLDIQHMNSVLLDVSGPSRIGSSADIDKMGVGTVALPEGTAVFTDLIIGSNYGSGLLDLYGTDLTVNNSLIVHETGLIEVRVDSTDDALNIASAAAFTLNGHINITFTSEPPIDGMLVGLMIPGDQQSALIALHNAGKLTWDTTGLSATASIIYDSTNTYVALKTPAVSYVTGGIEEEVWTGMSGTTISSIPTTTTPTLTTTINSLEIPANHSDNYGVRIRGYFIPQTSGTYTFWIASDDQGELWLSSDEQMSNKQLIAHVSTWTGSRVWDKESNQKSSDLILNAGTAYYIEVLMKEGAGGDNLAVAYKRNDSSNPINGSSDDIVPGSLLAPLLPPPTNSSSARSSQAQTKQSSNASFLPLMTTLTASTLLDPYEPNGPASPFDITFSLVASGQLHLSEVYGYPVITSLPDEDYYSLFLFPGWNHLEVTGSIADGWSPLSLALYNGLWEELDYSDIEQSTPLYLDHILYVTEPGFYYIGVAPWESISHPQAAYPLQYDLEVNLLSW